MIKKNKPASSQGYTLVELIIGIVIISIVFTIGYAGYRQFSRRQALTGVSQTLIADLRVAQQLALTGQKPLGATCLKLRGYTFTRVSSSNYKIYATCDNNGSTVNHETKSVDLATGVGLTATTNSILFKVLGQGTDLLGSNVLRLTHTGSTSAAQITVGTGGNVIIESTSVPLGGGPTSPPGPTTGPTSPPGPSPTRTPSPIPTVRPK